MPDVVLAVCVGVVVLAGFVSWRRERALHRKCTELRAEAVKLRKRLDQVEDAHMAVMALNSDVRAAAGDVASAARGTLESNRTWERRFWEVHGVVERVLRERDVWKDLYASQVREHLEGQAILENRIVAQRKSIVRLIATCNAFIAQHGIDRPRIDKPKDCEPLDAEPIGQARRYFESQRELLMKEAPAAFNALLERDRIAEGLTPPGATVSRTAAAPAQAAAG